MNLCANRHLERNDDRHYCSSETVRSCKRILEATFIYQIVMFHNSIIFIKIISVKSKIRKYSETEHNGIKNLKKINAYNKSEVNA